MTKKRVVEEVRRAGYSEPDAERAVAAVTKAILTVAKADQRVALPNFGIFKIKTRQGGNRRNPRTGETIQVLPRDALTFKPSNGVI